MSIYSMFTASSYSFWAQSQSSSSEEKQQGLSVDKDLLSQLLKHCLESLARTEPKVYLDPRVRREWMEQMAVLGHLVQYLML